MKFKKVIKQLNNWWWLIYALLLITQIVAILTLVLPEKNVLSGMCWILLFICFCSILTLIYEEKLAYLKYRHFFQIHVLIIFMQSKHVDIDDFYIENTIKHANEWLKQAKLDKQEKKGFSLYKNFALEQLDFIEI